MPFDPNKYLASKQSSGFDPDAYLSTKQPAAAPDKGLLESVEDSPLNVAGSQIGRNIPIAGPAMVKAGHGAAALLARLTPDGILPEHLRGKTLGELYDALEAEDAQKQAATFEKHPIAATAGALGGAAVLPVPGAGVEGAAGVAARIAGNAGISAADTAVRGGDRGDVVESGLVGGGIAAGIESIPYVGKALGAAKRLIPATEGSVTNKAAAKLAGMVPGGPEASAVEELYSNPALRRKAAATDFSAEAESLVPKVKQADEALTGAVGKRFTDLEGQSLAGGTAEDLGVYGKLRSSLEAKAQVIGENPKQFGSRSKALVDGVKHILDTGGEAESALPTYRRSIEAIAKDQGPEAAASATKLRVLNARKQLDDFTKNVDFDKLLMPEKDAILGVRSDLGKALKESFSGGAERAAADDLYTGFKGARDDLVKPLTFKSGSGARDVDAGKLESTLKNGTAIGNRLDSNLDQMSGFLKQAEPQIGKLPEVQNLISQLSDLRTTSAMKRIIGSVATGGGPTSQAVNVATQVGGAIGTGGSSIPIQLALLPITNPAAWVKIVDGLNKAGQSALADSIKKATSAIMKANPQVATRLYLQREGNKP